MVEENMRDMIERDRNNLLAFSTLDCSDCCKMVQRDCVSVRA